MLIEFTVGNFRSFKDPVSFSMLAAPITEHHDDNVFSANNLDLLKSAVVYGPNASGKSNLLKAMQFMRWFVFNSSKESQTTEPIDIECFKLSTETVNQPSFFEIVFLCDNQKYRYGFEVERERVRSEWLFFVPSRREAKLFTRDEEGISIGQYFKEGRGLQEKTRPNSLFLSVVAQFNGQLATKIVQWFRAFNIISGLDDRSYKDFTREQLENSEEFRELALKYLKIADFDIADIAVEKMKIKVSELPDELKARFKKISDSEEFETTSTSFMHHIYDETNTQSGTTHFDLEVHESAGTQKFLWLLGPLLDTLWDGHILIIDELDTRLHPLLTRFVVGLFHDGQLNKHAQLIFATHDTNLLAEELFRRDQVWFSEKDRYGATGLYSLVEYKRDNKKVRKDASFEKEYFLGKYGAIPFIKNLELLVGSDE